MNTSSLSEQKFMNRITAIIETNLDNEKFGVAELAKELGMSRSNLHRKVKAITKITVVKFISQFEK